MRKIKRVLIVTQYFYPEDFRINDLAFSLVKQGYHVDALVGIPNYPEGKFYKGYGIFKKRHEVINGVNIYRCFQFPRGKKASNIRLSLNYLSYAIFATIQVLFRFVFKPKYNAIIAFEPSPITLIIPAIILGKIKRTKVYSWILDIWPDSITDNVSQKQAKLLLPLLSKVTEWVYKHSDKILISSKGMAKLINRNHDYSRKIEYVPNWCDDFLDGIIENVEIMPSKGFNLVMAGTIGLGIGIENVIGFVEEMNDYKDINIIFIGGGAKMEYLREYFKKHNLHQAYVLGRFPFSMMPSFYNKADAMLLSLMGTKKEYLDVTVPARLQSYMSAGKPIFAMIGSGAAEVITSSECGFVAPADNYKKLAKLVKENYQNKEILSKMGYNARKTYEQEFTIEVGVQHFISLIDGDC